MVFNTQNSVKNIPTFYRSAFPVFNGSGNQTVNLSWSWPDVYFRAF